MSEKILVADDNRTMGAVIKHFLEDDGYEIIYAGDGEQAFEKACTEKPDLIILDIILPKMDGYQVARQLRVCDDEKLRNIPIMILTSREALIDDSLETSGLANAHLLKPFDRNELLRNVRELLARKAYFPK
jgi:DNA-binding response OmpR family regulator